MSAFDNAAVAVGAGLPPSRAVPNPVPPLIARCVAGERAAQEEFFDRYKPYVEGMAFRFHVDVDDIVQAVFVAAFRSLAAFQGSSDVKSWLGRITINSCLRELKRMRSRPSLSSLSLEDQDRALVAALAEEFSQVLPLDLLVRKETAEAIADAVASLPDAQRLVFQLMDEQGMTDTECAAALGRAVSQVRGLKDRARRALRERLTPVINVKP